jgi:NAD(P)-dependent dehydrogenase (short-subunit alcohol dehydrogenase family)
MSPKSLAKKDVTMLLKDQVALVTGAAGGIGRAISLALANAGADVALADRTAERLDAISKMIEKTGRRSLPLPTDVLVQDQVESMVAKTVESFDRLDILVNGAGTIILKPFMETSVDEFRQQMDLHFMATVIASKAAVPIMQRQGGGKIISMSSISGTVGYSHHSAYSPAKGAIIRFSQAIAEELKPDHINVNCIAPNAVDTPLFDDWVAETGTELDRSEWIQPEEIGDLVVYLCSPAARSITGETILLQGIYPNE